jgi:DNA-binding NtrC family response regulator
MSVILIVEDEIFIRQCAEGTIADLGHAALAAENLEQALVHLAAPRHIDAMFVDIRLNQLGCGGYDVADQGIVIQPGLRVLYTSGTPLTPAMSATFVGGGQFLQKPYSPVELEHSLGELLR